MKHPERVEDYLEHIVQAVDRAKEYPDCLALQLHFHRMPRIFV